LHMPVYIDNVVNCLGSYEQLFGCGKRYRDFLVITLGRGVGMAMILNGDRYRGARGWGGEFGHIPCVPGGRRCECGKRGCLEAYVADPSLMSLYHELCQANPNDSQLPTNLSLNEIRALAHQGNKPLRALLMEAGRHLGTALASMVNIFNPEGIILTGIHVHPDDLLFVSMREAMQEHIFSRLGDDLSLVIESVTKDRWAQGAGALVLRHFFLSLSPVPS
jgi:N-acetylglucosamine repressor